MFIFLIALVYTKSIGRSFFIFVIGGLFEISEGYLVWLWFKGGKPLWYGIAGGFVLAAYGAIATMQTDAFR